MNISVYVVWLAGHQGTHIALNASLQRLMEPSRPEAIFLDCMTAHAIDALIVVGSSLQYILKVYTRVYVLSFAVMISYVPSGSAWFEPP